MSWTRLGRGLVATILISAPPLQARQQPAPSSSQIRGIVRNAADDAPIARARVIATADVLPEARVTLSGADGRYTLAGLPAGSYTVSVTRTGYAPQTWGQGRSLSGTPIGLGSGQQLPAIDFALVQGATIVGRVMDEDGSPLAGADVEALVNRFEGGADALFSAATAQTDDRGEFRLFGLAPGRYFVSAADPAFKNVSTPNGVQHYSPTYYPGVALADQARVVVIAGPSDSPRIEFRLKLVPPANVSGQLVTADGRQLLSAVIILRPVEGEGVVVAPPEQPSIQPDGRFTLDGVPPGRYQIRARGQTDGSGAALFGALSVEVAGEDVAGLKLTLRPGAVLEGSLAVESQRGSKAPDFTTLRVRAPFVDGTSFGDSLTGVIEPDGSFALRGIMKGPHQIVVDGLRAPWVLKSVVYQGSNITDTPIEAAEKQSFRGVRVTITDAASEVTGTVTNARRAPVADAGVLVFARVPLFWMRTNRRMRVAYTDPAGRFSVTGLPAGEYVAVAAPAVDESDLGRRDRLEAWASVATPFRLATDQSTAEVQLQIVAPPVRAHAIR
jgi:hypothetical protein